ncbi:mitotic spindle assembly checkpoint protein MAD2B-like isoform X2 [Corticium candelabrum]|uniref:mitotic spindle assembly checkpoint protein MAD2B-like isoform X2 n=1 Tax=Corticium candelabrum TaxID=121492 RepID=UPI002E263838|nr:mitotic spindle assembly checkpoint protein MAD2B-like isoform X2 [Corticium candelabrum]
MSSNCSDVIAEFLEVAIHQILYCRNVYPRELFERRQLYQVPVHMSCHPELNSYIVDVISSVKVLLLKTQLDKVAVVLSNKDDKPVERFIFSFVLYDENAVSEDWHLLRVEMALRDFLLKISTCESTLGAAHEGISLGVYQSTIIKHSTQNIAIEIGSHRGVPGDIECVFVHTS